MRAKKTKHCSNVFLTILLTGIGTAIDAQTPVGAEAELPFSVPDIPAFKALGAESQGILKPTNPKMLSAAASEFYSGNDIIIPKSFAVEFSPFLLLDRSVLTLEKYVASPKKYTTRVSLATRKDSLSNISSMAIGLRIMIHNDGDPRSDRDFLKKTISILNRSRKLDQELQKQYVDSLNENHGRKITIVDFGNNVGGIKDSANLYVQRLRKMNTDQEIEAIKKVYVEEHWNASKMEMAGAISASSTDSLAKNLKYAKSFFWVTLSEPIGKKGQLVVTGTFSSEYNYIDHTPYFNVSGAGRVYVGKNNLKALVEGQGEFVHAENKGYGTLAVGGETLLGNGVWIDFQYGLERALNNGDWDIKTKANLKWNMDALVVK